MKKYDFVIVGTGGGGGAIAWMLAKAGYRVCVLEQGPDLYDSIRTKAANFDNRSHDEYRFRLERPDPKRRPRGDYVTFRQTIDEKAKPLGKLGGWTGTAVGGGSLLWGAWAIRPLPIDFRLNSFFKSTGRDNALKEAGYHVEDWSIAYEELKPYFTVAEILFAVCGDRKQLERNISNADWFRNLSGNPNIGTEKEFSLNLPFASPPYPETPVGALFKWISENDEFPGGMVPLPTALVHPWSGGFSPIPALEKAFVQGDFPNDFGLDSQNPLWSQQVRDACNMCGFCGEYLCWGGRNPKSGSASTFFAEITSGDYDVEIFPNSKAYEISYDHRLRRATGVKYLDVSNPNSPIPKSVLGDNVIVSCGAIQSTRLLLMSGGRSGLSNSNGLLGRFATFHLFGFGARCILPEDFQGFLHGEFGHTGTLTSFDHYLLHDQESGSWHKGGIITSIAKKNPMENLVNQASKVRGLDLLQKAEQHARTVELRFTGDDLPQYSTRVDLDPYYVDEFGLPVARVTRRLGAEEENVFRLAEPRVREMFLPLQKLGVDLDDPNQFSFRRAEVDLFGDHQMGTCRMGEDPRTSVVDRFCRLHEVPNVFVVDTSFMPTGLGVNPMITTVANALRVGSWIINQDKKGGSLTAKE
ncbi:MAG: GMC family oxidoreductase [Microcystis aeruginosa K13-05]|jgi:choline dehydrogenase-like flavoprotein|uniref:GMC oxidoreductase n=1 Tax=unclassified Microcystis TaxID=2643300 RepID=UPI0022BB30F1|nr:MULTISPECIES: GMC family oxidoreductase [unclassified Microcystis]NCR81161.1 GMC family oxidoreductase [Microcystis aeruginosa K13-10]NCR85766.1 GMC family oxidoreductase [Microcystis aeruginosa K13-05]MCZ8039125.1 GMC family oxidoreductase [Microcystis sp. LE17-20A]MCZ8048265.1 GMC family oxidoreductase [Microcystis sp. LE19-41.2A]MCZ8210738.1 GMC family oxidoreductase [Microcystis sp. LE19-8.1F]